MFYRQHPRHPTLVVGPSMTKQSHKDECDIYNILNQFKRTGIITHIKQSGARFEDLPSDLDFQMALQTIMDAESNFALLPSKIRAQYDNDPAKLLAALQDPSQHKELRELGIMKPLPIPVPPDPQATAQQPTPTPSTQEQK